MLPGQGNVFKYSTHGTPRTKSQTRFLHGRAKKLLVKLYKACVDHDAEKMFELLMGNEVAPRREFIIDSADAFDTERIDA